MLADLDARLCSEACEPPNEPRGLEDGVVGMEERSRETAGERLGQLVAPFGGKTVLAQRLELRTELVALVVAREPQAARPAERIAPELSHPADVGLGQTPVLGCLLVAEPLARAVVGHGATAEREATVAAARARRDRARLVQAHALARLRERQRAGDAGDAAADDLDVGDARERARHERRGGLREPVGVGHAAMLASRPIHTSLLGHGARELELGQGDGELFGGEAGRPRELVGARRCLADAREHEACRRADLRLPAIGRDEPEALEHVLGARERRRAEPEQGVRAGGERTRDLARNREDLSPLLEREVGRDQRAAALAGLDDDGGGTETGHDPVPRRETPRCRLDSRCVLRDDRPLAAICRASSRLAAG